MKIQEAIDWVDEVKPNAFTEKVKIAWLNNLEGTLAAEVFLLSPADMDQLRYGAEENGAELLVGPPYDDIYTLWLAAKIDEANGEYEKYQNSMQAFNARRAAFVCWFAQLYDPVQGYITKEE